ncbi:putative protein kinase RLK-Pelle-DLSV family [Helianthus debilis subsp. tardiflorus]
MEDHSTYLFFIIVFILLQSDCAELDTISANHVITYGKTIISSGKMFELGFFSPGNSKNQYLGIWYKKISTGTLVWVANRETPVTHNSGMFKVSNNGNLVILSGGNTVVWSSNSTGFECNETRSLTLDWSQRFNIIHGIARGILYLHQDSRLQIIQRDLILKAGNILLDSDMNPKISDFGLARRFVGHDTIAKTNKVVGTHGYISPEYVVHGHISIKSDVFSYGVLVLEIVSGMKNREFSHEDQDDNLLGHGFDINEKIIDFIQPSWYPSEF